ncbi:EamA/RhaT family transporter [Spongiactinospora rosea]|uniref:EamA/RhaT family transporter n=1 Tax=Spongiactinospora rosea TaxID=2248750 RepID=A0A366LQ78_9ACTN|nr:DMT family transporter [Spongiactinospora rosea]RBQ15342.1 EamA/RhaT family transporter [Spongiactinospora rosea]
MNRRTWWALILLSALWGAAYPLIEIALQGLSPVHVVLGRVTTAALMLTPLALRYGALQPLLRHPRAVIETALMQSTAPLLLLTVGQQYVPSGLAGILVGAQPLFVALLAVRFAPGERPQGWPGILGLSLGFLGLILLFGFDLRGGREELLGGVLLVGAAVCYAAGGLMIHRRHADAEPLGVATCSMLVTTCALLIPGVLSLPSSVPDLSVLGVLMVLGVVCTGGTLVLFYTLVSRAGPAQAALAFYLSPAFAVLFGVTLLHERLTAVTALGLVAIVAGAALAGRSEKTAAL